MDRDDWRYGRRTHEPRSEWKSIWNGNAWWLMLSKQRFVFLLCLLHRTWIHSIVKEKRKEIELSTDFSALKDCELCSAFWWMVRARTNFHLHSNPGTEIGHKKSMKSGVCSAKSRAVVNELINSPKSDDDDRPPGDRFREPWNLNLSEEAIKNIASRDTKHFDGCL